MTAGKTDDVARAARAGRDRPADDPALPELPFQRDDGPLRLGRLVERRDVLHVGAQGTVRRDEDRRRPSAQRCDVSGARDPRRSPRHGAGAGAQCAQREAARRLHPRRRRRHRALEQDHREAGHPVPPEGAAQGVPSAHRPARGRAHRSGRQRRLSGRMGGECRPLAAERRRSARSSRR